MILNLVLAVLAWLICVFFILRRQPLKSWRTWLLITLFALAIACGLLFINEVCSHLLTSATRTSFEMCVFAFQHRKKKNGMSINPFGASLESLIAQQEQSPPLTSLADLHAQLAARQAIEAELQTLVQFIHQTRERLQRLPKLPDLATVQWAQAMLALPNLAFLEVDTDGLGPDAQVLRVLLLDGNAQVLVDTCLHPSRPVPEKLLTITGLSRHQLEIAPLLVEGWPLIVQALRGHYLLSYNLAFDREMLHRQAERGKLDLPYLVADCLMERATTYFHATSYPKLTDLCTRLGHPLSLPPQQDAFARARGQLHLLTAMAQGIIASVRDANENEDDDEPPF